MTPLILAQLAWVFACEAQAAENDDEAMRLIGISDELARRADAEGQGTGLADCF